MNEKQLEAVEVFDRPLLVLAGAGSGKTKVITQKIAKILQANLAMPSQILAVTFTNKAANEMLERVQQIIKIEGRYLNIGTFHRMSLKILRKYADVAGYTQNFTILDSSDQQKVISSILKRLKITDAVKPPVVGSFISKVKEKFIKPHELEKYLHKFPDIYARIEMQRIYVDYQNELKRLDAMDFDDLIFNCVDLLQKNDEIRKSYQNLFKYILIDEYQDINGLQQKWIKLMLGENQNITCVGDDDQSIYGWRGSDISYILDFQKEYKNAIIIKLEQNYRSTKDILAVASKLIDHNENRHGKTLWTDNPESTKVNVNIYQDSKAEAKAITSKIQDFIHRYKYKDFAILVRAIRQTRAVEEAMVFAGISYKIIGGLRFYERKEVKDILAYIKILISNEDDIATERVLSNPKKGIGEATITQVQEQARAKNSHLLTEILQMQNGGHSNNSLFSLNTNIQESDVKPSVKAKFSFITDQILKWRKNLNHDTFTNVIKNILIDIQYEEFLKKEDEETFEQRIDNINELLATMESFSTAGEFLDYVSLATSTDDNDNTQNAVSIMTIHASKGLEYPFVFLPGWNQGIFPSDKTVEELGLQGIEEERRLGYVAITRAMERVCISSTKYSAIKPGFSLFSEKSMFLEEILETASRFIEFEEVASYKTEKSPSKKSFFHEDAPQQSSDSFFIGNLVFHKTFGFGNVVKTQGTLVTVKFSDGTEKTIREDFLQKR